MNTIDWLRMRGLVAPLIDPPLVFVGRLPGEGGAAYGHF